jgi:H+-transporting ATPase
MLPRLRRLCVNKPGLSVIIDSIKESRKIFQRMQNYSIYRIAETTRVLIFLSLSILVFNFYPLTAVMIVILALLNELPIMMLLMTVSRCKRILSDGTCVMC